MASDDSFYILQYSTEAVQQALSTNEGIDEDGIEAAFDVRGEMREREREGAEGRRKGKKEGKGEEGEEEEGKGMGRKGRRRKGRRRKGRGRKGRGWKGRRMKEEEEDWGKRKGRVKVEGERRGNRSW